MVDSPNLRVVKGFWRVLEQDGLAASMEAMLNHCHEDVELSPYFAEGRTLRGADEVREFYREREAAGATLHASAWSFEERGQYVIVTGSLRVQRPDGSIADAQIRWNYRFRDGLVDCADFAPLEAA